NDVATRLACACRLRAERERMLTRVQEAQLRAEATEHVVERLRHEHSVDSRRHMIATERLAQPAMAAMYSPAARMALTALERRAESSAPIAIVTPEGVDPVPYLARAHLAGTRKAAPLIVVDGANSLEHDLARWSDGRTSPL